MENKWLGEMNHCIFAYCAGNLISLDYQIGHTDIDQCHCWRNLTYQQSTLMHNVGIFLLVIMAGRISHNINGEPGN